VQVVGWSMKSKEATKQKEIYVGFVITEWVSEI
jgi:hypothetical protein